jgi:MFS family permease
LVNAPAIEAPGRRLSSTPVLLGLALCVGLLAFCADRIHNGDFYLQLLGGRHVVDHGLSVHDPFPTIAHGRPWLNGEWLAEVIFYAIGRAVGFAGIAVAYAGLLALGCGMLLWASRRKGAAMLLTGAAAYALGLPVIVHPRPAGFTLAAFCGLVVMLVWASKRGPSRRRTAAVLIGVPALVAVWANLHGGFLAGLLLIALFAVGLAIDGRRGLSTDRGLIWLAGAAGLLSLIVATVGTPLGPSLWSYIASFRNPALARISTEWGPTYRSPSEALYLVAFGGLAAWLWWRTPAPRRAMPALATAGCLGLAAMAARNLIFVGPAIVFLILCTQPDRPVTRIRPLAGAAIATALASLVGIAAVLGPPRNASPLGSSLVSYAIAHPPRSGRIASYAGVGSYILWRAPHTRVVLNGWLEHFTSRQLRETYALLDDRGGEPLRALRKLQVGGVIARRAVTARALEARGFRPRFRSVDGTYLVRAR